MKLFASRLRSQETLPAARVNREHSQRRELVSRCLLANGMRHGATSDALRMASRACKRLLCKPSEMMEFARTAESGLRRTDCRDTAATAKAKAKAKGRER